MARGPHRVVALVANGVTPFELGVACEVFGLRRPELGVPWYDFQVAAIDPPPLQTTTGFSIQTPHGLNALRRADTVLVTAWHQRERVPPPALLAALRAAHARGARIMSVCSGAFVLAAAGLLDGRRATTHWMYADELARRYPTVRVDPKVLYVDEGDVLTSAGTAAGIDLCLHVVRRDYGAAVANAVARRMVVAPHREGGQAQYVTSSVGGSATDDRLGVVLTWASAHLDRPLGIAELAGRARMSERTFARRFKGATGTTPYRWLLAQRVLSAQRVLETTSLGVERVAERTGFGSAASLRAHFHRALRTSPAAYRRSFRAVG